MDWKSFDPEGVQQLMEVWYTRTLGTENYGFFYKILEAIREQIKKDSADRKIP